MPHHAAIYTHRRGRTAIHEAGHALVALHERRSFEGITIVNAGRGAHGMIRQVATRIGDDEVVRILLAGVMAVRYCRTHWRRLVDGGRDDLAMVAAFFCDRAGGAEYLIRWNVKQTASILADNWAILEALAEALLRDRELSYEAAAAIARMPHSPRRPPRELDERDWDRLVEHILWRVNYPRGIHDVLAEVRRATRNGAAGE